MRLLVKKPILVAERLPQIMTENTNSKPLLVITLLLVQAQQLLLQSPLVMVPLLLADPPSMKM